MAKKEKIQLSDFFGKDDIKITDQSLIFQEVKFWKKIYTSINLTEKILFKGNSEKNKIELLFNKDSNYFYLIGEIDNASDSIFVDFIIRHNLAVVVKPSFIKQITGLKKGNLEEVTCSSSNLGNVDVYFYTIRTHDPDNMVYSYAFKLDEIETIEMDETDVLANNVLEALENEKEIDSSYLDSSVFEVYLNNRGEISNHKDEDFNSKLIEIPTKRIKSFFNKATEYKILYSDLEEKNGGNYRYIGVRGYSKEVGLSLTQLFLVIV